MLSLERHLVYAHESPCGTCQLGYLIAPVRDCGILGSCSLPHTPLCLNDPTQLPRPRALDNHPIRVVEANSSAGFNVVHAKFGGTLLVCCPESGEPHYIWSPIQESGEVFLEFVVRRGEIEDRLCAFEER